MRVLLMALVAVFVMGSVGRCVTRIVGPGEQYTTIGQALAESSWPDIVFVKKQASAYQESFNNTIPAGVTLHCFGNPMDPANWPTIKPPTVVPGHDRVIRIDKKNGITIRGFILDGTSVLHDTVKIEADTNGITIQHCKIINGKKNGIHARHGCTDITLADLVLHDNGKFDSSAPHHGIYFVGSGTIERCTAYNNGYFGIQAVSTLECSGSPTIIVRDNIVYNNAAKSGLTYQQGGGIIVGKQSNAAPVLVGAVVSGNVVSNEKVGIRIGHAESSSIYNNTVSGCDLSGIALTSGVSGQGIQGGLVYNNRV